MSPEPQQDHFNGIGIDRQYISGRAQAEAGA
jgi:hypothetical protein